MSERRFQSGFTLVEVLVTVVILGLLAAVVFPVVADRASDADPAVVANDLANFRTGTELFRLDVRPALPGDVEDLINRPTSTDASLSSGGYSNGQINNWEGPYVDISVSSGAVSTTVVRTTAFDGQVLNGFVQFDADVNFPIGGTTTTTPNFLAIRISNLATSEFNEVDGLIDNEPTGGQASGKFRFVNNVAYFLAQPIK